MTDFFNEPTTRDIQESPKGGDFFNEETAPQEDFFNASPKTHAPITQAFGNVNPDVEVMSEGVNNGVDYGYKYGDEVKAPQGQWVVEDSFSGATGRGSIGDTTAQGYGNNVLLKNPQTGEKIRLSHLSSNFAKPGMTVRGGDLLGLVGDTGNTTGPHLDAELQDSQGNYKDISKTAYSY